MIEHLKGGTMDKLIGVAAISTPLWLTYFNMGVAVVVGVGGLILLGFRIAKARQEYLKAKREAESANA